MFEPGQPVTCIDDKFPLGIEKLYPSLPVKGELYVIRDIVPGVGVDGDRNKGAVCVYLIEIQGSINKHGIERGFDGQRFAPLQTDDETEEEEYGDSKKESRPELVPAGNP